MAGWTRMGQSRFKHQPAPSHHQERPPVARCGGYDWWHAGTLCKVETNFTYINTFLHKIITPTKRWDKLSMYHILLKISHVVASRKADTFFKLNFFPNHQNHQKTINQTINLCIKMSQVSPPRAEASDMRYFSTCFQNLLPPSLAFGQRHLVQRLFFLGGSENCRTWITWSIKSWYLGYGSQAGQGKSRLGGSSSNSWQRQQTWIYEKR